MAIQFSDVFIQAVETALKTGAAAPDLATAKLDLFQNDYSPNRQSVTANFTVADFTSYAEVTPVFTGPFPDQVNGPFLRTALNAFQVSATPTQTNLIYGWYMQDAGGLLICSFRFPTPIPMIAPSTPLAFVIEMRIRDYSA
jgi:hypothetical protein